MPQSVTYLTPGEQVIFDFIMQCFKKKVTARDVELAKKGAKALMRRVNNAERLQREN